MARRKLGFWRRFAVMTVKPTIKALTRRAWAGMEHIPAQGGVIIVVNHISHADPLAVAHYIYDAGRWPSFLAKSSLFDVPVLGYLLKAAHQIPVRRGTTDAVKALEAARAGIRNGEAVVIYPEGTTSREPELWPMRGKTGAARLWLDTRVPVIPVVMWGPEQIFDPRTKKLDLFPRKLMRITTGAPIDLSAWADAQPSAQILTEITDHIMLHLRDMLVELRGGTPPPLWIPGRSSRSDEERTV
ncbi:1-acyl-sn-glycerol-3-phosphate acyltransferase [Dactylosporangium roseum]|uniref:1-acyl-sn-glycerol-3-phosphate acyltransferase n=1 Tax=Dactylosporangium roseum TaxID=47989 RepID=A0ABY5Z7Z8_9ACTN|nr:lysophospholipid acyltransferase family protein [Dactylosporangium roseum]UWZ38156.1 1-acyl-sn-glycerol-3-phosphate acyltransferase [Dactylosporangium roseum]